MKKGNREYAEFGFTLYSEKGNVALVAGGRKVEISRFTLSIAYLSSLHIYLEQCKL